MSAESERGRGLLTFEPASELAIGPTTAEARAASDDVLGELYRVITVRAVEQLTVDLWRGRQLAETVLADLGQWLRCDASALDGLRREARMIVKTAELATGSAMAGPAPFCAGPAHQVAADRGLPLAGAIE